MGSRATLPVDGRGEVPGMAGPGDEPAAGAGGHRRLRASHADREQVISVLKAGFVQGRLDRDEFDLRVGQALASRTCGELAALTADLPSGLVTVPRPGKAARARARSPMSKVAVGAAMTIPAPAMVIALLHTGNQSAANVIFYVLLIYLMAWSMAFVVVVHTLAESYDRSRGKLPPRRTQRGQVLEGEETGTGDDLMLSEARGDVPTRSLPGRAATRRGPRSLRCGEASC